MGPSPAGVNLVEQRAGWIVEPRGGGFFGLEVVAFKAGPALQRIVMPGAAGEILVDVEVAMIENVEAGALLVSDNDRHRVLEFLAEVNVQQAGIERAAPHADVEPAGAR